MLPYKNLYICRKNEVSFEFRANLTTGSLWAQPDFTYARRVFIELTVCAAVFKSSSTEEILRNEVCLEVESWRMNTAALPGRHSCQCPCLQIKKGDLRRGVQNCNCTDLLPLFLIISTAQVYTGVGKRMDPRLR